MVNQCVYIYHFMVSFKVAFEPFIGGKYGFECFWSGLETTVVFDIVSIKLLFYISNLGALLRDFKL